MYILGLKFE